MSKILHVSDIAKNLLNVTQFYKDNHVYFEFHLIKGQLHKGLYVFDLNLKNKIHSHVPY